MSSFRKLNRQQFKAIQDALEAVDDYLGPLIFNDIDWQHRSASEIVVTDRNSIAGLTRWFVWSRLRELGVSVEEISHVFRRHRSTVTRGLKSLSQIDWSDSAIDLEWIYATIADHLPIDFVLV